MQQFGSYRRQSGHAVDIAEPTRLTVLDAKLEVLTWIGQAEEGIEWIQKAMRLNPYHPERFWGHLGRAYFVARRYSEAVKAFQRISRADQTHLAFLAACHAQLGDAAAAKSATQELLKRAPDFSIERFIATQHYKHDSDREHH